MSTTPAPHPGAAIRVADLRCRFGSVTALDGLDLEVARGEVHALLGRNGAGKTTLLRLLAGLVRPSGGTLRVLGRTPELTDRAFRGSYGYVPSGTRSFYLRLSGRENLVFFARLEGLSASMARRRALDWLDRLGLADAAGKQVGLYSQGMQRRLALARAMLAGPPLLLLDEVTHDLDPAAAEDVRRLVRREAGDGTSVVWVTQRVEEIRGLADTVTVLHRGRASFQGDVAELVARANLQQFVVRLRNGTEGSLEPTALGRLLGGRGTVEAADEPDHFVLRLRDDVVLGEALADLTAAGIRVLTCSERRPVVETAMERATGGSA